MPSTRRSDRAPERGEVWFVEFDPAPPAIGHEQAYPRPALIVSVDLFNAGGSDLAVVLPMTRTVRQNPLHIVINPPEGGVRSTSVILCDQITTVSHVRLRRRQGRISAETMATVGEILRILLGV